VTCPICNQAPRVIDGVEVCRCRVSRVTWERRSTKYGEVAAERRLVWDGERLVEKGK